VIEALLVLCAVALLAGFGLLAPLLPPEWLVAVGWDCAGLGLLVGVPAGLWYHVRLRACLLRAGRLPTRWWLHPSPLNDRLEPAEKPSVMRFFYLGAAAAALALLGCLLVGTGVVLAAFRAGVF